MRQTGGVSDAFREAVDKLDKESFQALYGPWDPLPPSPVAELLSGSGVRWRIAGGRAARVGAAPRRHQDTDVTVLAGDVDAVRRAMRDWHLWAEGPGRPRRGAPRPAGPRLAGREARGAGSTRMGEACPMTGFSVWLIGNYTYRDGLAGPLGSRMPENSRTGLSVTTGERTTGPPAPRGGPSRRPLTPATSCRCHTS